MSATFRALLIGVPRYRDPAIDDLAFVERDLAELDAALTATGYGVTLHDPADSDRDGIDSAVETFFQDAAPGETLLLYLSGHGIHHGGQDFLVPRGALMRSHDFAARCLPLDFTPYVERSRAGDVAVFVDACREGIDLREMGGINAAAWSSMRVRRVGDRHYCHVYACSPGERARYATADGGFSLFSRALCTLVADDQGPGTLGGIADQLQRSMDALTAEHNCPRQQVRVRTETDMDRFTVIPRPRRAAAAASRGGDHPWVASATDHPAWAQTAEGPAADALREAVTGLVGRLARAHALDDARLADDPWRPLRFAERMSDRVRWLLAKVLNAEKLALSPAEAALLVLVPYLYTAHWSRAAVRVLDIAPTDLGHAPAPTDERASYEHFFGSQSRLVRRAARATAQGDTAGATGIAWWLFGRWLARRPRAHHATALAELLAPDPGGAATGGLLAELLDPEDLLTLLRAIRTAPDLSTVRPVRQLAGATDDEQDIREHLLVALLSVAHRLALDPTLLPEVIVDHLGISYAVDLEALHRTLAAARWDAHGRTRVLRAACPHPAVELALRQQAATLDALLGAIDVRAAGEPQLAPLGDLPAHATADQLHATPGPGGQAAYESTDLRFRLADDRIQELLMGERLYGDPALAIRELYQNALDACRYRDARTTFLRRRRGHPGGWAGRITFTQGTTPEGRAYIECADNGVGMGERELREVFSHAGMRFADLPEYLDEQAAWAAEGIEMHPNSQFGIGVLSYFMIADDITVTTCRLDPDGHPGHRLQVDIAGPGALFYIHDLGRAHDAGTTVRLYLRDPAKAPSCPDLLRRLLWIAPYEVTAEDGHTRLRWPPNVLSPAAPLGAEDPYAADAAREDDVRVDATSTPETWWCSVGGGVLADGLWAGIDLFGAVVNLTGAHMPELTVDRRGVLHHDAAHVTASLYREIQALLADGATVVDHDWLNELMGHRLRLADEIVRQAVAGGRRPWRFGPYDVDVTAVGHFGADATLLEAHEDGHGVVPASPEMGTASFTEAWRALAWARAGAFPGVTVEGGENGGDGGNGAIPVALPSDQVVLMGPERIGLSALPADPELGSHDPTADGPADDSGPFLPDVVKTAIHLGVSPRRVAARLAELGRPLPDGVTAPESAGPDDLVLMSRDLDGESPFLPRNGRVPLGHVLSAARLLGRTPAETAARLAEVGHPVEEGTRLPETVRDEDLLLMGTGVREGAFESTFDRWLALGVPVPLGHVLSAARLLDRTPAQVLTRLADLGHALEEGVTPPDTAEEADVSLLRTGEDKPRWLTAAEPVPPPYFVAAGERLGLTPAGVAARLGELGPGPEPGLTVPDEVGEKDLTLLSHDLDRAPPWLSAAVPVPAAHVVRAAGATGLTPEEVVARLSAWGHTVAADPAVLATLGGDDLVLLDGEPSAYGSSVDWRGPLHIGDLVRSAAASGRTLPDVAARLAELGCRVPEDVPASIAPWPGDSLLLSRDLDSAGPWLRANQPVPHHHAAAVAARLHVPLAEVVARLAELGYRLGDDDFPETLEGDDLLLISRDLDSQPPWLPRSAPVSPAHVLRAAVFSGRSPREVRDRLVAYGYQVPEASVDQTVRPGDAALMGEHFTPPPALLRPTSLLSVLRLAHDLDRTPYDVATRLAELGYPLPEGVVFSPPDDSDEPRPRPGRGA
ncbi:caspase family protein [Streptomyces radicis]|uniref:Peptidase C14 caspase catalytic subunit p20 n=1 Tax=Streptomyces radicis TaxID=1750517 RepID=A0A3A9WG28_9ACTN|nr:caspase family protein [Streptomyces radicis]RKN12191.1 hypothetical protein D7319_04775 [Streptomyces radicis]RKN25757.1 hypothetical protein D7318_05705 [Streptomyces radicis]